MSVRLRSSGAGTDRPVLVLALVAVLVAAVGANWLVQAAMGGRPAYRREWAGEVEDGYAGFRLA